MPVGIEDTATATDETGRYHEPRDVFAVRVRIAEKTVPVGIKY